MPRTSSLGDRTERSNTHSRTDVVAVAIADETPSTRIYGDMLSVLSCVGLIACALGVGIWASAM